MFQSQAHMKNPQQAFIALHWQDRGLLFIGIILLTLVLFNIGTARADESTSPATPATVPISRKPQKSSAPCGSRSYPSAPTSLSGSWHRST